MLQGYVLVGLRHGGLHKLCSAAGRPRGAGPTVREEEVVGCTKRTSFRRDCMDLQSTQHWRRHGEVWNMGLRGDQGRFELLLLLSSYT